MALPLQKRKTSFYLNLSSRLYPSESIEKSLKNFHSLASKANSKAKDYAGIKFSTSDLKSILEFANFLLSLNR